MINKDIINNILGLGLILDYMYIFYHFIFIPSSGAGWLGSMYKTPQRNDFLSERIKSDVALIHNIEKLRCLENLLKSSGTLTYDYKHDWKKYFK